MEVDLKLAGELYGMRRDSEEWYVIYSRRRILEMRKKLVGGVWQRLILGRLPLRGICWMVRMGGLWQLRAG